MATAQWGAQKGMDTLYLGQGGAVAAVACAQIKSFAMVLPALTAKPLACPGNKHGGACPKSEQAPDPSFHRSHFPAPQQLPELAEILQSAFCFSPDKGITSRGWEPGRRGQQRGLGKRGHRLLVFFCRVVFIFFFSLRSCSVILFYFLALQAAGRITWLPGKPLGKCTGLLPASGHQNPAASEAPTASSPARPGWEEQKQQPAKHLLPQCPHEGLS